MHRGRIRTGTRLGEAPRAELLRLQHRGDVMIALLVGCERRDVPGRERHMRGAGEPYRRVVAREPLDNEHLREGVRAAAAEFSRESDAEKAELAQLLDDMPREGLFLVP